MERYKILLMFVIPVLFIAACKRVATPQGSSSPEASSTELAATTYMVEINPAHFVAVIDNPYFSLVPGTHYVYEGRTEEGLERIEIEVMADAREVMGVQTIVLRDTVFLDGVLIEDTLDWYAQHKSGDVWYFGEEVDNYENGVLANHDGSWEAGVDGALPGIMMYANPANHIGQTYRQEYYAGEAEDMAKILSATESVGVPFGSFENVLQTEDWTPLEPDLLEQKFYAPSVGVVKELNLRTGDETVLVEMTVP